MTVNRTFKIAVLDFVDTKDTEVFTLSLDGYTFEITVYNIGWNFNEAKRLVKQLDGVVDAFTTEGLRKMASFENCRVNHEPTFELIKEIKLSQFYSGIDLQCLFASWALRRFYKENPHILKRKKVLFHCASLTPFADSVLVDDAELWSADSLFLTHVPVLLKGRIALRLFLKSLGPVVKSLAVLGREFYPKQMMPIGKKYLQQWLQKSDVFVTYCGIIDQIDDYSLLKNKLLIVDKLTSLQREKVLAAGAAHVLEWTPNLSTFFNGVTPTIGTFKAMLDLIRMEKSVSMPFDQFTLDFIEKLKITPRQNRASHSLIRRCAFVIHPLGISHLSHAPGFKWLRTAPQKVRKAAEKTFSHVPLFRYGQLTGACSTSTGQEIICDLYVLPATPRAMLQLDEYTVYDQLLRACEDAHKRGALLIGLGAYTKVVGDSGVTVARKSPIPVTTGNSYSASSTLWAARVMVERMGFVPQWQSGNRLRAKAMIIGATGSIGRVSALLLALVFDEIVLVATQADRLLELKEDIERSSPGVKVTVRTNPNDALWDTDLIVTATSNRSGRILDITKVKPGAVICDCSRPLDISKEEARSRPDVLIIESGEIDLPGNVIISADIGLPKPSVYACLAETILLTMEGRYESFSLSRELELAKVKEIYRIGVRHGAKLSAIRSHFGVVTEDNVLRCRALALNRLSNWNTTRGNL